MIAQCPSMKLGRIDSRLVFEIMKCFGMGFRLNNVILIILPRVSSPFSIELNIAFPISIYQESIFRKKKKKKKKREEEKKRRKEEEKKRRREEKKKKRRKEEEKRRRRREEKRREEEKKKRKEEKKKKTCIVYAFASVSQRIRMRKI